MQTLLFDLDGTLIDSVPDLAAATNVVRVEQGLEPVPTDVVARAVGDGARTLVTRVFADLPDLDVDRVLKRFRAVYLERCTVDTVVYPGVMETLEALMPRPMAIVSNKPQVMCDPIARHFGFDRFMPVVVGQRRGVPVKPDPSLLRIALQELGVEGGEVWMVGDSHNDVASGRALGATTVGVTYGIGDVARMRAAGPDHVVAGFGELAGLLRVD